LVISKKKASIVEIKTITTATNWIFRIAEFIRVFLSEF